jgi:hypothetical protein
MRGHHSRRVVWIAGWLLALALVNPYVRGDGNGYYAWLVSPIIDGDLDFTNQFARADPLFQSLVFDETGAVRDEARTVTGHVGNQWSVGPAVMWAPWFLVAHLLVLVARSFGAAIQADGYSWPYLWCVSAGTVTYGMVALWCSLRSAVALGLERHAGLAVLGIALASSLPVYQVFLPFHVHALSAAAVAAVVCYALLFPPGGSIKRWVTWGVFAGLMVQIYQLNGVLLIAPLMVWSRVLRAENWATALRCGVAFAAAGLIVCVPQLAGKAIVYGSPLVSGYQDQFFFSQPRLWQTLLSTNHGWWLWTPIAAVACAGWISLWRARPEVRPFLAAAVAFYLVVASYQNWHGLSSYGNRFFLSLTVLQVAGLAMVLARAGAAATRVWSAVLIGLAVWNAGFIFQWGTNIIPNRGAVSLRQVAVNQVTVVPDRMAAFLRRYIGDRRGAQDDVEREDADEQRRHKVER